MALPAKKKIDRFDPELGLKFWGMVKQGAKDECWLWQGPIHTNKYGMFRYKSQKYFAHRVAYELAKGPIVKGLLACHTCDNRPCCNPNHIFPSTHEQNMADMAAKGRGSKGPKASRYSEEIKRLYATGDYTQEKLAQMFEADQGQISRILSGNYSKKPVKNEVSA